MPEVSGWYFTDATRFSACPRCYAQPGEDCRTPKGRKANIPHIERTVKYRGDFPDRDTLYRCEIGKGKDRLQAVAEYNRKLNATT